MHATHEYLLRQCLSFTAAAKQYKLSNIINFGIKNVQQQISTFFQHWTLFIYQLLWFKFPTRPAAVLCRYKLVNPKKCDYPDEHHSKWEQIKATHKANMFMSLFRTEAQNTRLVQSHSQSNSSRSVDSLLWETNSAVSHKTALGWNEENKQSWECPFGRSQPLGRGPVAVHGLFAIGPHRKNK